MQAPVRTTAIVVTWQAADRLAACLDALLAQPGLTVLVVDNASSDATEDVVATYPEVRLLRSGSNLGYAGACTLGLQQVDTPFAALVNDDAVVRPGWLAALELELDRSPACALVTGTVLLGDGRLNSAGGVLDRHGRGADRGFGSPGGQDHAAAEEVFYAPATACLLRTGPALAVGGMDPRYFLYFEDVDLSWRLRLSGRSVRYTPHAVADHLHGASTGASGGSTLHTFHDSRNRLLTLVKDAPWPRAVLEAVRLPLTAASLAGGALRPGRAASRRAALVHAGTVARAWLSFLALLPHALRERRTVSAFAVQTRAQVHRDAARMAGDRW